VHEPKASDIEEGNINSHHFGKHQTTSDRKPKLIFLPPDAWINLKQEQKDQFIAKRDQEHLDDKPFN
jgi:hypothetical protein